MSYLRSVLFSTPLIGLATIVMGTLSLLASCFDRSGRWPHRIARVWAKMLLAVSFIRVRAEGLEKIDANASYVFIANHTSFMDIPVILAHVRTPFRFFAKKGLFRIPFLGTHLRRAGHLPVDHSSPRASLKSMTQGAAMVARTGVSVLLFPEGGRTELGESLREFQEGAAYIAIKAGVPVVPIAIVGLQELLPMGSIHIRAGCASIRIGDPIPTKGLTLRDRTALTQRLYEEMAEMTAGGGSLMDRQIYPRPTAPYGRGSV
jgi:1-acyl-sn-glycerol-3-phosphate acyltransferase